MYKGGVSGGISLKISLSLVGATYYFSNENLKEKY